MDKTIILVILPELLVKLELKETNALLDKSNRLYVVVFTNLETGKDKTYGTFKHIEDAINKFDEILQQRRKLLIG